MSKQLQRFDFGTLRDFRGPLKSAAPIEIQEAPPPPPPPPTYNDEQMQMARIDAKKLGYNEGFLAGQTQQSGEQDTHTKNAEAAMTSLSEQIGKVMDTYNAMLRQQSLELSELALLVAKKVAGEALRENHVDVITSLVVRSLPMIMPRPRITIELNPKTMEATEMQLMTYLVKQGYEGAIQLKSNPDLGAADARLDWGPGQIERSTDAIWAEIESLLARVPLEAEIPNPGVDHG